MRHFPTQYKISIEVNQCLRAWKGLAQLSVLGLLCHSLDLGAAGLEERGHMEPFMYGGDISALAVLEQNEARYRDSLGNAGDAIEILNRAGMNTFRLRLFVDPDHNGIVANDLEYTLKLARRIKDVGARFMLDLHYSDTWADPGKQYKPKEWKELTFEHLVDEVEQYTATVLERFLQEGLCPDYLQLGNEITNGMLWPDGQVEFVKGGESPPWDKFVALQLAAHRGYLTAFPHPVNRPLKILHIESTGDLPRTEWYLKRAMENAIPFDIVGFSYYPEWHGTIGDLEATLHRAADITNKSVAVVEVAYPWKADPHWTGVSNLSFPLSPEGQQAFVEEVYQAVKSVPGNLGAGLVWWYPEAVLTEGLQVWLGGSCGLFDDNGQLLPAASSLNL